VGRVIEGAYPNCRQVVPSKPGPDRFTLNEAVDCGFTTWTLSGGMNPLCSRDGDNLHILMRLKIDGHARVPVPGPDHPTDQTAPSDHTDTPPEYPQPETPSEINRAETEMNGLVADDDYAAVTEVKPVWGVDPRAPAAERALALAA